MLITEPFPDRIMPPLLPCWWLVLTHMTFLQNLILKWWGYQVFPAKMTLVCIRSLCFYDKTSFSPYNLKVPNVSRHQQYFSSLISPGWSNSMQVCNSWVQTIFRCVYYNNCCCTCAIIRASDSMQWCDFAQSTTDPIHLFISWEITQFMKWNIYEIHIVLQL